jgi:hypothetical protein
MTEPIDYRIAEFPALRGTVTLLAFMVVGIGLLVLAMPKTGGISPGFAFAAAFGFLVLMAVAIVLCLGRAHYRIDALGLTVIRAPLTRLSWLARSEERSVPWSGIESVGVATRRRINRRGRDTTFAMATVALRDGGSIRFQSNVRAAAYARDFVPLVEAMKSRLSR